MRRYDKSVEEAVRAVLMEHWDPIGVRGIPAAADEYDTQVHQLTGWLARSPGPSAAELRQYLDDEAYRLMPSWDHDTALDRTAHELLELRS